MEAVKEKPKRCKSRKVSTAVTKEKTSDNDGNTDTPLQELQAENIDSPSKEKLTAVSCNENSPCPELGAENKPISNVSSLQNADVAESLELHSSDPDDCIQSKYEIHGSGNLSDQKGKVQNRSSLYANIVPDTKVTDLLPSCDPIVCFQTDVKKKSKENYAEVKTCDKAPSLKIREICDSKTSTFLKHMYPDLKSIQYCEEMHNLVTSQALVKTYSSEYLSKVTIEANQEYEEFMKLISGVDQYPLYNLIHQYENAKRLLREKHSNMKELNSQLKRKTNSLWKPIKKEASMKGRCEDGNTVSISHSYTIKELDELQFQEVIEILREQEKCLIADSFYSYSEELMRLKIEQYLSELIKEVNSMQYAQSEIGCEKATSESSSFKMLKMSISILFDFQRQPTNDKIFLETCQKWLKIMVFLLLQTGKLRDQLFIVNHVIRCPNGIKTWASEFVQVFYDRTCSLENKDIFFCSCLDFTLLMLYLILNPVPGRDHFLKNVKVNLPSDAVDGDFTILDSEGEEEEKFTIYRQWSDNDLLSLLNQIPLARLYDHIFCKQKDGSVDIVKPTEERMLKIFAYSAALMNIFFIGLETYGNDTFIKTGNCIFNFIRHSLLYVTDYWKIYTDSDLPIKPHIQAEYDRLFFCTIFKIFRFEKLGIWKILSGLPYDYISRKILWNILWIFHCPESTEESVYMEKDVDEKILDESIQSKFLEKMKSVSHTDIRYLLMAYEQMAISSSGEEDLLRFLLHEIFQITVADTSLRNSLFKEGMVVLSALIQKYPHLLSCLIKEVCEQDDDTIQCALQLFKGINISKWTPSENDIRIISTWLLSNPLSKQASHLARLILRMMNWEFDSGSKLALPQELHQKIALLVLQAYMKFDTNGNEWLVSRGLAQMLQFATVAIQGREDEGFVSWAWNLLFSLKLHGLDRKCPSWVQIYDGYIENSEIPNVLEDEFFQPLRNAYEDKHSVGLYLMLVMTNVGSNMKNLLAKGLDCFSKLVLNQQYAAAIHALYYIVPFFVKESEMLLSQTAFVEALTDLIVADVTVVSNITGAAIVGAVLHKMASMIKFQIYRASESTIECGAPLLKLWIKILLKVVQNRKGAYYNIQIYKESAKQVFFLLDVIVRISAVHPYTRDQVMDLLYTYGNPVLTSSANSQSFWSKLFYTNCEVYPILQKQTLSEYHWLSWFVLFSEIQQKVIQDVWLEVQKEMVKSKNTSPETALKVVSNSMKITQIPWQCLPIYRWALQALQMPASHPALPLFWQQFFLYYFEKIFVQNSGTFVRIGRNFFRSGAVLMFMKQMKNHMKKSEEFYRNHLEYPTVVADSVNGDSSELSASEIKNYNKDAALHNMMKLFQAFQLWLDDETLCDPNLCMSTVQPRYFPERLALILEKNQEIWYDLVSISQIKDDLDQKVHVWHTITNHPPFVNKTSENESLCDRIVRHINNYEDVKPLVPDSVLIPPMPETKDSILTSWQPLVELIEKQQAVIFEKAKCFTELESKLKQLNFNYKNWIPQEFKLENSEVVLSKVCYKGMGRNKCAGPAMFKLKIQKCVRDEKIHEKIDRNRTDYFIIQDNLVKLPVYELSIASLCIENCIRDLALKMKTVNSEEAAKLRNMGISLFYYQIKSIERIILSVAGFSPSRQFFSSSIESLAKEFIEGREDQLLELAKIILDCPEAGVLASPFFNPNIASADVFLDVYKILTSSVTKHSPNSLLVLLSKIDLQFWLKEKNVGLCLRRQIFEKSCNALLSLGCNPPVNLLPIYEILKKHFNILLVYMFPELYGETVLFLLNGIEDNSLAVEMWYEAFHSFGCAALNEGSTIEEITNSIKKFAHNQLLPANQQIFVTIQPINLYQVLETLQLLQRRFLSKVSFDNDLYIKHEKYLKPIGIFFALLCHLLSGLFVNESPEPEESASQLWDNLYLSFQPWLHPIIKEDTMTFPWLLDEVNAQFMLDMFTMCIKYFHEQLKGTKSKKSILSHFWHHYVQVYVSHGVRHYSLSLYHAEFLNLPWHEFYPDADDIEDMCTVLQSKMPESKTFLAKISLKIPWKEFMYKISSSSLDYIGRILGTLGRLLIISGWDESVKNTSFHQSIFKTLEDLPWRLVSLTDTEALLNLYFCTGDLLNMIKSTSETCPDVYILHFLKRICCMLPNLNYEECHAQAKRLIYVNKYFTALNHFAAHRENHFENNENFKAALTSVLKDVDSVCRGMESDDQVKAAIPLVREALNFLNCCPTEINDDAAKSVISWIKANPRSPLLLPCLTACSGSLSYMNHRVMIAECCITTRFKIEIQSPSEVKEIWQLLLSYFKVPIYCVDEFLISCKDCCTYLVFYMYILHRIPISTSVDSRRLLLIHTLECVLQLKVSDDTEVKSILLWDKFLELCIKLASDGETQEVKRHIARLCKELTCLSEDRSNTGFFAAIGLGHQSELSVNYRFLCRVLAAFLQFQIPDHYHLRMESMAPGHSAAAPNEAAKTKPKKREPAPSADAMKALENLKALMDKKPYAALRTQIDDAVQCVIDPNNSLLESRQLLKKFAILVFSKESLLYSLD